MSYDKKPMINYTSKDFDTIKQDLVEHAKRYYPDSYRDFNESGFGSMMLDAVAYVGDMLSFYLDYQVNESFLETAIEFNNVRSMAEQYGYKFQGRPAAFGIATFYVIVQAANTGLGPEAKYIPIIKAGTEVRSSAGANFILTENVDFSHPNNEVVAARINSNTGVPTHYAIRAQGAVKSGAYYSNSVDVGSFARFRRVKAGPSIINEIMSVYDSDGHRYYEVDHLSQEVIYRDVTNPNVASDNVRSILKPFVASRRFVVEQDADGTYIRFGYGSDLDTTGSAGIVDPAKTVLKMVGRDYITDTAFDPTRLLDTNKFGVGPSDTTLKIIYSSNNVANVNVAVNGLNAVERLILDFPDNSVVSTAVRSAVATSVEVTNDTAIMENTSYPTNSEMRYRAYATHAAQNRAVTRNDYEAYAYMMPPQFGAVHRACIVNDPGSTNRRMSLYVISEDSNGKLASTNNMIKKNLKNWMQKNKMINDAIDIYDAKIVNFAFDYTIVVDTDYDKNSILNTVNQKLISLFTENHMYVGEPFYITDVYSAINKVIGVVDTIKVKTKSRSGGNYSSVSYNMKEMMAKDGTAIIAPKNVILEIKYPSIDIRGMAV
tara:strand:- start:1650 stop:3452 length:1803 start_codon:yes stop_codon:yes gene_type:complete